LPLRKQGELGQRRNSKAIGGRVGQHLPPMPFVLPAG